METPAAWARPSGVGSGQPRARGFAIDDEEIAPSLQCVAVPLLTADGTVCAAISVTKVGAAATAEALSSLAATLRGAAHALVLRVLG